MKLQRCTAFAWGWAAFSAGAVYGQECDGWFLRDQFPGEPMRAHAIVYDSDRQILVLFTGLAANGFTGETWEWSSTTGWVCKHGCDGSGDGPSGRDVSGMAYDSRRGLTVLVGGFNDTEGHLSDTWEWDGSVWNRRTDVGSPGRRSDFAIAYDVVRGQVVIFGGNADGPGETWTYDGGLWRLASDSGPSERRSAKMVFDSRHNRIVLFGGQQHLDGAARGDTWFWDENGWLLFDDEFSNGPNPSPRYAHAMSFDDRRARVVLFGGGQPLLGDTWELQSEDGWRDAGVPGPSPRQNAVMVYHNEIESSVLVGGEDKDDGFNGETWVYPSGCSGGERLFASCRQIQSGRNVPKGTLAGGCAGRMVVFALDGECQRERTIRENGKCRAKWKGCSGDIPPGPHTITVTLSCGTVMEQVVECP